MNAVGANATLLAFSMRETVVRLTRNLTAPFSAEFAFDPLNLTSEDQSSIETLKHDKSVDAVLMQLDICHRNISTLYGQAFTTFTWELGLKYGAIVFVGVAQPKVPNLVIWMLCGVFLVAMLLVMVVLRAARRGHHGNRVCIAKCEAALGFYASGAYLKSRPFMVYDPRMMHSKSLRLLEHIHLMASVLAILLLVAVAIWR